MMLNREAPRREPYALLAAAMMLAGCLGKPDADPIPPSPCDGGSGCAPEPCTGDGGNGCGPGSCPGPGCDEPLPPFLLPEGGELRLERFQDSADDSAQTLAAQAFFFKGQTPPYRSFAEMLLKLRPDLEDKGYTCLDLRAGNYFDNGKTEEAQDIADTRTYHDVGAIATLTSTEEPFEVIRLDRFLGNEDPDGATDPSAGLQHAVLYKGDPAQRIRQNTTYLPAIEGTANYPTLDLKWGMGVDGSEHADADTGRGTPQIYMPSAFALTSPTEEEFFTPGAWTFTRGQDLVITYTAELRPTDWPDILPYANFYDGEGRVRAMCFRVPGESAEDGGATRPHEFVVPYEVLDIAEPSGRLVFGRLVHVGWENQLDTSRLDLIGMESKRAPYTIQDAPTE